MNLVTGATGHIGNVLVRELLRRGERVRALVRPGKRPLALEGQDVEIVWGDILDTDSLEHAMRDVDVVYHLADLMPFYTELTGAKPLFTRYSLEAVCSNSHISHAKASRELGFHPRPARQAILDSVRWLQAQAEGEFLPETGEPVAEATV
jgi:nucleoside-diphosphate-sugar epimerase